MLAGGEAAGLLRSLTPAGQEKQGRTLGLGGAVATEGLQHPWSWRRSAGARCCAASRPWLRPGARCVPAAWQRPRGASAS